MSVTTACVFCAIIKGQRPAELVLDHEAAVAFLDRRPLFPGHVLLVPRRHVGVLADLPANDVGPLFRQAQLLCRAVECALDAAGTFVAMNNRVSQSVPHLHVHIVPRSPGDGLRGFFWPRVAYRDEEHRRVTADAIRRALANDGRVSLSRLEGGGEPGMGGLAGDESV